MAKPIIAYGDSNTVGSLLPSPDTQSYIAVIAQALNVEKTVRAMSGHMMSDQSRVGLYGTAPSEDYDYTAMLGTNDSQHYSFSSAKLAAAINFYRNILVWITCPTKRLPRLSTTVKSGSWSNTPANDIGVMTTSAGSYLETTVSGSAIYVSYLLHSSYANSFQVRVDGVLKATVNLNGPAIGNTLIGGVFGGSVLRIAGLDEGDHVVRVTQVSGTTFLDYIAGNEQEQSPRCFVGDVIYRSIPAYGSVNSDANVIAYNTAIAGMISELSDDGRRVYAVHHDGYFDRAIHYGGGDGIHPTIAGHEALAQSFLAVMDTAPTLPVAAPKLGALYNRTYLDKPIINTVYH